MFEHLNRDMIVIGVRRERVKVAHRHMKLKTAADFPPLNPDLPPDYDTDTGVFGLYLSPG